MQYTRSVLAVEYQYSFGCFLLRILEQRDQVPLNIGVIFRGFRDKELIFV